MWKETNRREAKRKERGHWDKKDCTDTSSESGNVSEGSRKRERDSEGFKKPLPKRESDAKRSLKKTLSKLKEKESKIAELERKLRQKRDNSRDSATQSSEETTDAQEATWKRFMSECGDTLRSIQYEAHYSAGEGKNHYLPRWVITEIYDWLPEFTTLKLAWTLSGRWVKIPKYREYIGDDPHTGEIGRIEKYIDND